MWTLEDFVRESNRIEGIQRDPFGDEISAHQRFLTRGAISVKGLEDFVAIVQPGAELRREVGMDVRVGNHIASPGGREIEISLENILARAADRGAYKTQIRL